MERGQFTFYASYARAISKITNKSARCDAYDVLVRYALFEELPDLGKLPDVAAIVFDLIKPTLDAGRNKAGNRLNKGKSNREQTQNKSKSNREQTENKTTSNEEQTSKEKEKEEEREKEKEGEREREKEKEGEREIENECYIYTPPCESPPKEKKPKSGKAAEVAHKHGEYGWVKLTDAQYIKLISDLGEAEAVRCITYVDEAAQSTGNKNEWKDWNLVVRKCHRDAWGIHGKSIPAVPAQRSGKPKDDTDRLMERMGGK